MRRTLLGPYFPPEGAPSSLGPPMTAYTRLGPAATPATPGAPPRIVRLRPSLKTRVTWPETLSATTNPRWPTALCRPNGPSRRLVTTVAALPPPAADAAVGTAATAPAVPSATSDTRAAFLRDSIEKLPRLCPSGPVVPLTVETAEPRYMTFVGGSAPLVRATGRLRA